MPPSLVRPARAVKASVLHRFRGAECGGCSALAVRRWCCLKFMAVACHFYYLLYVTITTFQVQKKKHKAYECMIFANRVAIPEKKNSRVTFPGGNYLRAGVINSSQAQMQAVLG